MKCKNNTTNSWKTKNLKIDWFRVFIPKRCDHCLVWIFPDGVVILFRVNTYNYLYLNPGICLTSIVGNKYMKKYHLIFKTSAILSYLFFVYGLSQLTLVVQNYWQFSSQIGNFFWIKNLISLVFIGLMIWILVKAGHGYLFVIPKKKWLWYTVLTVFVTVLCISFNFQTARHVQSTSEGWAVLIGYSGTNFAELGLYLTLFFLGPLMEELIYRGLFQHAFFKDSKLGLDLILPSVLFALPHFSSFPNFLDILVFSTFGVCCAGLTRYTKSIYPSYAVHVINNIVATLPFLLTFLHRIFSWNKIWKWVLFFIFRSNKLHSLSWESILV